METGAYKKTRSILSSNSINPQERLPSIRLICLKDPESKTLNMLKKEEFFLGNKKMDMKDAWNLRPAHLAMLNYFDAVSPAVQALSFIKEVFDGILDGSKEFSGTFTITLRAKQHFILIACYECF